MSKKEKQNISLQWTRDFSLFNIIDFNREVDASAISKFNFSAAANLCWPSTSLVTNRKYKHNVMMMGLKEDAGSLMRARSVTDYKLQLQAIYNRIADKKEKIKVAS